MRVEEIALRQEIRQMLSEAGINKTVLKQLVKDVIDEEVNKAIKQAIAEMDLDSKICGFVHNRAENICKSAIVSEIGDVVRRRLWSAHVHVDFDKAHMDFDKSDS